MHSTNPGEMARVALKRARLYAEGGAWGAWSRELSDASSWEASDLAPYIIRVYNPYSFQRLDHTQSFNFKWIWFSWGYPCRLVVELIVLVEYSRVVLHALQHVCEGK